MSLILAYVGPGAGMALAGSFLTLLLALLTAVGLLLTWPMRTGWRWFRVRHARRRAAAARVVILGLDGLDPRVTELLLAAGELPNLARLQQEGTYARLQTTWPPLSPVAWSTFSTGVNPGKHAIFDFVRCNPLNYQPEITTVSLHAEQAASNAKGWFRRFAGPELRLLRRSKSFWRVLSEQGIFSAILRVPVSFPPERFYGVQLAAASVPDLRGTQGTYTHFLEVIDEAGYPDSLLDQPELCNQQTGSGLDPDLNSDRSNRGRRVLIHRRGEVIQGLLPGPADPGRADLAELQIPLSLQRNERGQISLHVSGQQLPLEPSKFSPWVRVTFRLSGRRTVTGICRFLLHRWEAPFSLYCSPLNLDPTRPAMPVSSPASFARYLAAQQGPFATLGLAEDTTALNDGVLSAADFLAQAYDVHSDREQMFSDSLQRVRRGLVACVFDAPDRIQHMFWKAGSGASQVVQINGTEEPAPVQPSETIRDLYRRLDYLVGRTRAACDERTALVVLSDHGFQSFTWAVDLNAWLAEQGYLCWKQTPTSGQPSSQQPTSIGEIDWTRTRAFAFGLCGLSTNLQGRERSGIVAPGAEYADLVEELRTRLTGLRHPDQNQVAILEAAPRATIFHGPYLDQAPDLIIGYNAGYRVHWDTALGGSCGQVFSRNMKHWQGDHCQHPAVVPGVLFCNRRLNSPQPRMIDIAPTVLDWLGVEAPSYMDGKSLRCDDATS